MQRTNRDGRDIRKSVVDELLSELHPQRSNNPYRSFVYSSLYPQQEQEQTYSPSNHLAQMELNNYINFEVSKQQMQMAAKPAPRPALAPLQMPTLQRMLPPKKALQQRHLELNVKLAKKEKLPELKPLDEVKESANSEVQRLKQTLTHSTLLFGRLTNVLQMVSRRYDGLEEEPEPHHEEDDDDETEDDDDDVSDSEDEDEIEEVEEEQLPPPPAPAKRLPPHNRLSSNSPEIDPKLAGFPKRIDLPDGSYNYLLGPNGTTITSKEFGQVAWTDAPVATRGLLLACFTSDDLATHTLTGKPSPAFYGRERPPKKMLNRQIVEDIIVSVRNRTGGKERHIRGTITTKCADTAKKYKRRAKKAAEAEAMNMEQ